MNYQFDDISIDVGQRQVSRDGEQLDVGGLTFDLLLAIVEAAPNIVSADELAEFITEASKDKADGWISFYWGRTPEEYGTDEGLAPAIKKAWLERFPSLNPWPPRP